jgi:hypothetical protein
MFVKNMDTDNTRVRLFVPFTIAVTFETQYEVDTIIGALNNSDERDTSACDNLASDLYSAYKLVNR